MNAPQALTFSTLLAATQASPAASSELRRLVRSALVPLLVAAAAVGLWSTSAPLAGAVVAPAQVKVELNRRTVQHQEGGIVREILVRDGQKVRAGDALVIVGNVRDDAELSLLRDQWQTERLRVARTRAEAMLEPSFAPSVEPGAALDAAPAAVEALARQQALFTARRRTLDQQVASLQSQIRDARSQVQALSTRIGATETAARLSAEELGMHEQLVQQGFIQRTRLLALQRDTADYQGRVGEQRSDLAVARQRIGELEARIAQARNQYQAQAADELREATARQRELEERLRPSQDQSERQVVRAPLDGEVMSLRVAAVGQSVGPREPIADVVPEHERLVVEARIRPQDIDKVRKGGAAEVRFDAFDARRTPLLPGRVSFVSPDRVSSADGRDAWFTATVEVDADATSPTPYQPLNLRPGMPAEVFVTTAERTLLQYLLEPLQLFQQRALREP